MKYAIFLQVTDETWDYLRKKPGQTIWNDQDPVTLYDTKEEAQEECKNWNTGSVVEYPYFKEYEQERAKKINANIPPSFLK